tara:strand:+ start:8519 stop:8836 length:318 start_codon:yes stop_codon:yes gene_type:complete
MSNLQLINHEVVNDLILLQWSDGSEHALPLKVLRQRCPCATCAGETDVFGNVYKGPTKDLNDSSYQISGIQPVGYYAIRPFWADGHNTGIYSYEYLYIISNNSQS